MVKEVVIDPNGKPFLIANVKMIADPPLDVLITYEFFYWSAKKPERKKLIIDYGNNKQNHDDFFWLRNPDNPAEKPEAHLDRVIHVEVIANAIKQTAAEFNILLEIYQEDSVEIDGREPIETLDSGTIEIKLSDGDVFTTVRGLIKLSS